MPGTTIETSTINREYQLPYPTNKHSFDVFRLIAALTAVDADVAALIASLAAKADLNSPALVGTPTAPTAASSDDSNQVATTAFVQSVLDAFDTTGFAPINNPTFTGDPKAPTKAPGDNTTSLATTAFVDALRAALVNAAPAGLDTLGEIAASLGGDAAFAATTAANIAAAVAEIPNYVIGLTAANNAATPNYYIDVQPGSCRFSAKKAVLASVMTKRMNTAWAEGNNAGALDTGVMQANKSYHWYVIRKLASLTTIDFVASLSNTSAGVTVPAGWEILTASRIFSVLTDGSSVIRPFKQVGNEVNLTAALNDFTLTSSFSTNAQSPLACPDGISTDAMLLLELNTSAAAVLYVGTEQANANAARTLYLNAAAMVRTRVSSDVRTKADGTVYAKADLLSGTMQVLMFSYGWKDYTVPRIGG